MDSLSFVDLGRSRVVIKESLIMHLHVFMKFSAVKLFCKRISTRQQ